MNILSIQSHVAYGHAGNSSAVFPLQRMGFNVWPVNTVMFSNHTGYDTWKGPVFQPQTLLDVIEGIEQLNVMSRCNAVLSGYMGDPAVADVILHAVDKVKKANPQALYCCDPVMGDRDTGLYVNHQIPAFFRDQLLTKADILTPNHFELEILSGQTIHSPEQALSAARSLLGKGPRVILVTSLIYQDSDNDIIEMMAVTETEAWTVKAPLLHFKNTMSGCGDATSALFLAKYLMTEQLKSSLEHVAGAMYAAFKLTHQHQGSELMLIESQDQLVKPQEVFVAQPIG
ncbi:pyridoxal kinase PdxY [Endozoicomonas numazuensis]|uniref:pyridoxal kinase n=1 Tax=Endozoicomonas numazuensis TaxID=1137799 RepID=A0A081NGF0_9GAMM|nr:pyridoxal kinase PdxY [Endozoicomonas numazuensis]KEQ17523.1 pyridoxamine kinase [Endozoicomonas numazuensis]